jgi:hypothetical protein
MYDLYCATVVAGPSGGGGGTDSTAPSLLRPLPRGEASHARYTQSSLDLSRHLGGGGDNGDDGNGGSPNHMQLPAFLWFARDAGLTLPSVEKPPVTTATGGGGVLARDAPSSPPPLMTYSAAAAVFEANATRYRAERLMLVSSARC